MFDFSLINEVTICYQKAPPALRLDCEGKDFTPDTVIHTIRVGNVYVNSHDITVPSVRDSDFEFRFSEICARRKAITVYDFAFCLSLYNSQGSPTSGIKNILEGHIHETAPVEYAALLRETHGWVFWEYQFENVLKLFTYDRRLPPLILKEYRRDSRQVCSVPPEWIIGGLPVLESLGNNMFERGFLYSLILKPAWTLFRELDRV